MQNFKFGAWLILESISTFCVGHPSSCDVIYVRRNELVERAVNIGDFWPTPWRRRSTEFALSNVGDINGAIHKY
jgi:hypothetical protein